MDDTTIYITEIFLNWFYRLITYVKLLFFIQAQIRLGTNKQQQRNDYISGNMNILHTTSVRPFVFYYIIKHWQEKRSYYATPSPILYTYWLGMRVITLLLSPMYHLFSEATPKKIVGTEGEIKVILPEYQVYKCFKILNNCAIQNSKLGPFLMDF
jgi:uncharacterized protein with PQ loop repeat